MVGRFARPLAAMANEAEALSEADERWGIPSIAISAAKDHALSEVRAHTAKKLEGFPGVTEV